MKKIVYLVFIICYFSFSQSSIEGYIFDKNTNESLPFATIKLISTTTYYTIVNEDGKFELNSKYPTDSIEVRHLGFQIKKVPVAFFEKNTKLYLTPLVSNLNEVFIVSDKNYISNLLYKLIQKYRTNNTIINSKTFFSLASSTRGIPIEQIEGFYNGKQSLSKGLEDLSLKNGRFGQNKMFSFYSIHTTKILNDFQLFRNSNQILPKYPGNMSLSTIKAKYFLKIEDCKNCNLNEMEISFIPKKLDGDYFLGKILFDSENLIIKRIELKVSNPVVKELSAIIINDEISLKEIDLAILFNPLNFNQIQSIDFNFDTFYQSEEISEIISTNSFLYFYDFQKTFQEPYFTNTINFYNDYDKILALNTSEEFWQLNYQFPKSFNQKKALSFLEKNGYLINFTNTIPLEYIEYVNPSVIRWNSQNNLNWAIIKENISEEPKEIDRKNYKQGATKAVDKEAYTISEIKTNTYNSKIDEYYKFSYSLNMYTNELNENVFATQTLFDINSSFCKYNRIVHKLNYISLVFDIYEIFNRELKSQLLKELSFEDAQILSNQKFNEATLVVEKMASETNLGLNFQSLASWKLKILEKLKN